MKQFSSVDEFLGDLSPNTLERVLLLRNIIMKNFNVTEHIKWNAPSYMYGGDDRITFSIREDSIKIIIHMGVKRKEDKNATPVLKDTSGIIKWNSDIRGTITFDSKEAILLRRFDFINIVNNWLAIPH